MYYAVHSNGIINLKIKHSIGTFKLQWYSYVYEKLYAYNDNIG